MYTDTDVAGVQRILSLFCRKEAHVNYVLETQDLVKSYKGKTVVNSVNLHVKKGEIYGFVGPNGAGKTTVMKMLLNLTAPDSGEIRIFGERIGKKNFECLKRMGSIIEVPCFYEKITGEENLKLHCEYMGYHNHEEIPRVLEMVNLQNIREKAVSHYSLGMKQRLAIARAILTKPELLILDEPINALDPEGIREMRALFLKLNQKYGTTIFISSHILSEVEQIADRIGIIQKGRLLKEISMADIRKYQTDYIELEVEDIQAAGLLLEEKLHITNFKILSDRRIEIYDLSTPVKEISAALVQNGVDILRIGIRQNSLEDFFFQVIQEA